MEHEIKKETRPWGEFVQYVFNEKCTVKIITVKKGEELSLQSHENRDELWVAIDNDLKVELDGREIFPKREDIVFIPRKSKHRLSAPNKKGRILEVSFGDFDEKDEIRYEDKYGRK
ncbi:hypothetical protein A2331_01925 [Candidatus Falkowbacteria bacterium RIFOXYB2_FULL_34_18]|uniref:Mannose-6-phosphate isomerase type II C-terminal domain-containing protein n=1 Tax=Candidatus Falkowbacteria bacterium RIFOXYD2_FULL_34_120 TaxID=1798007 RepID=A0A1F5TRH5_9BACT|nr:MAG: hypothetical protein A2331_01925 [Candidatus Falkowbacteria bacterium RIFOXYB2_FULL_34_18]OGF29443.1 MAG: hypothetical protein A2500_00990 [Candidatus Falkowbacteria bacterium RIFOXYC12_FULL_34_55]OGF36756.1 MAG: hypothetical protein A2466_03300 [Candidatus Falkowbacteria bacterium RIFOXYC2_FULL_34_220]OGF38969.1 MAG: hypothetical protein A2515_05415 [Candidatus Falkowbacteria bacterium RIFOXYD12_FULL_34_57]OGF41161.1 MAG: hypothetical protein A2531_01415 [Candidatus Falkowbacteria bact